MAFKAPKKLIEVALPLDAINAASAREKSIRYGHPSTLHLWWARRPIAAARAILFAQLVNDPGGERGWGRYKGQSKEDAERERRRLFGIIERLVRWENLNNETLLAEARAEVLASWEDTCQMNAGTPGFTPDELPPFLDPFAGGGAIPLEAQRLGLVAHAADLNPVAVLLNKAQIELPPLFAGLAPVGPVPDGEAQTTAAAADIWEGASGLAEDVRRYGLWMRAQAEEQIGHLYPGVSVSSDLLAGRPDLERYAGRDLSVMAWLWARTVPSPNPAVAGAHVPLVSSFWLSKRTGKEAWLDPVLDGTEWSFDVRRDAPPNPKAVSAGTVDRRGARCLLTGAKIPFSYVRAEATAGRMRTRLIAVVCEGDGERIFLPALPGHEDFPVPEADVSDAPLPDKALGFRIQGYGMTRWRDLFTPRQLVALATFTDLVADVREKATADRAVTMGEKAGAYGDTVAIFVALLASALADRSSTQCSWNSGPAGTRSSRGGSATTSGIRNTFSRHAFPMTWDFAEAAPFSNTAGGIHSALKWVVPAIERFYARGVGCAFQSDVRQHRGPAKIISTDPPYYDNIGYADLSDFFYFWLRRSLGSVVPSLFRTILVPKADELIASPFRQGSTDAAKKFFMHGMGEALATLASTNHPAFPATIYYAFKQSESDASGDASTGWETFLAAVLQAGWAITATWPVRTERGGRSIGVGTNALASSIVLALRPRDGSAGPVSRRDFLRELGSELPESLSLMIGGSEARASVAPVDLAQAAIGPGMAIFSRHEQVLEADGSPMSVRQALVHINKAIDDYFTEAEGDMDADTRFCVDWFQQYGFEAGSFGEADVLARAKGTAVDGVVQAGVAHAAKGKVRLLSADEYPSDWDPAVDTRTPVWEACHQLCRELASSENSAGGLLARMPGRQESIRRLAYRLFTICDRKGWAQEAGLYNSLITSWPAIVEHSRAAGRSGEQLDLV